MDFESGRRKAGNCCILFESVEITNEKVLLLMCLMQ